MNTYLEVSWNHFLPNEPIVLLSELDSDRWEIRKVEMYADGRMNYCSKNEGAFGCELSIEPLPTVLEIGEDPQFVPREITKGQFEGCWSRAVDKIDL
jgi:hypothetical protein